MPKPHNRDSICRNKKIHPKHSTREGKGYVNKSKEGGLKDPIPLFNASPSHGKVGVVGDSGKLALTRRPKCPAMLQDIVKVSCRNNVDLTAVSWCDVGQLSKSLLFGISAIFDTLCTCHSRIPWQCINGS